MKSKSLAKVFAASSFLLVLIMGIVNFFANMTYEGMSSINVPFLAIPVASAAAIDMISGVGEFPGYARRSITGQISDTTGCYWLVTCIK